MYNYLNIIFYTIVKTILLVLLIFLPVKFYNYYIILFLESTLTTIIFQYQTLNVLFRLKMYNVVTSSIIMCVIWLCWIMSHLLSVLLHSSVQFSVRFSHANLYISNFAGSSYLKNSDKSYLISFIVHGSGCKNLVWRFTMIPTLKRSAEPRNSNKSASVREREI